MPGASSPEARGPGLRRVIVQAVRAAARDLAALALPTRCAACGAPGGRVCARCAAALAPNPGRREIAGVGPVWFGARYEGVPAALLREAKGEARPGLIAPLAPLLRAALAGAGAAVGAPSAGTAARTPLIVAAVPGSARSRRARGFTVSLVALATLGVRHRAVLRLVRAPHDQRGLGVVERERNVAASMRCAPLGGIRVLLVDDVVTTGATLREAARAVRAAGGVVVGAAVIAATPKRVRAESWARPTVSGESEKGSGESEKTWPKDRDSGRAVEYRG